jgi:hypothetical protein
LPNGQENAQAQGVWPLADSPAITDSPDKAEPIRFVGNRKGLFWLAFKTGLWTILTLGLYRFWMKTRMRRWYWSAIRPAGHPFEYVGNPWEKLLGFLIAVVILAFYIGIVNLILMFVSFSLLSNNFAAYAVSFIGVIPLWFYARYRARRYVLARTRWRGVRFGLEPGAWGYAFRALGHWTLTVLTAGLMWPRMTFWLEKYVTDRTFYGSARMNQGGDWKMLMPAITHAVIGVVFTGGAALSIMQNPAMAWMLVGSMPWLLYGLVHYSVESRRLLANEKTAGGVGLWSQARPRRIARIYGFGYVAVFFMLMIPLVPVSVLIVLLEAQEVGLRGDNPFFVWLGTLPRTLLTIVGVLLYFSVFLFWNVLTQVFLTMPILRHYAQTLAVTDADKLYDISQRARDEFAEAEGFAEALDVGAAL